MKFLVKGLREYSNGGTTATYNPPQKDMTIEADSVIEVVAETPVREPRGGDVGLVNGEVVIQSDGNAEWAGCSSDFYKSKATRLFNLLDLVAEMKKITGKDTSMVRFGDCTIQASKMANGIDVYIDIAGKETAFHSDNKDAFSFACQIIALCGKDIK